MHLPPSELASAGELIAAAAGSSGPATSWTPARRSRRVARPRTPKSRPGAGRAVRPPPRESQVPVSSSTGHDLSDPSPWPPSGFVELRRLGATRARRRRSPPRRGTGPSHDLARRQALRPQAAAERGVLAADGVHDLARPRPPSAPACGSVTARLWPIPITLDVGAELADTGPARPGRRDAGGPSRGGRLPPRPRGGGRGGVRHHQPGSIPASPSSSTAPGRRTSGAGSRACSRYRTTTTSSCGAPRPNCGITCAGVNARGQPVLQQRMKVPRADADLRTAHP